LRYSLGGRVGSLVEIDYFGAFDAMRASRGARLATDAEYEAAVRAAREEVLRGGCVFPIFIANGQR
jgi:hypothetical protein